MPRTWFCVQVPKCVSLIFSLRGAADGRESTGVLETRLVLATQLRRLFEAGRQPFIIKPLAAAQNEYHIDPHKPFYTYDFATERTIDDRSTELCA
jgi:hypothetical protein